MTYSSSIAAGRQQRFGQKNQNSASFRDTTKTLGPVSNTIVLIVLACVLGLLYLTQVTKTNAFGYQIEDLKDQKSSLQQERDALEVSAARLQALERVKNSNVAKGLVSVAPSGTVQN
jgi:hypothetical protein